MGTLQHEGKWTEKAENEKAEFLVAGQAHKPRVQRQNLWKLQISVQGTLISASTVPHHSYRSKNGTHTHSPSLIHTHKANNNDKEI